MHRQPQPQRGVTLDYEPIMSSARNSTPLGSHFFDGEYALLINLPSSILRISLCPPAHYRCFIWCLGETLFEETLFLSKMNFPFCSESTHFPPCPFFLVRLSSLFFLAFRALLFWNEPCFFNDQSIVSQRKSLLRKDRTADAVWSAHNGKLRSKDRSLAWSHLFGSVGSLFYAGTARLRMVAEPDIVTISTKPSSNGFRDGRDAKSSDDTQTPSPPLSPVFASARSRENTPRSEELSTQETSLGSEVLF